MILFLINYALQSVGLTYKFQTKYIEFVAVIRRKGRGIFLKATLCSENNTNKNKDFFFHPP